MGKEDMIEDEGRPFVERSGHLAKLQQSPKEKKNKPVR